MVDVRCEFKKFAELDIESGLLDIKCNSAFCKDHKPNIVVLHTFDVRSGELVKTIKFKNPPQKEE